MRRVFLASLIFVPGIAGAFNSGSTGVDGDFNPPVSIELVLPPNGVFNFRTVNIPKGVTITFKKNATNTPVFILSQTDIVVSGTLDLSGKAGTAIGSAGDGVIADDGQPGKGGPGGFDGGQGGFPLPPGTPGKQGTVFVQASGATGLGPGGGAPGTASLGFGGVYQLSTGGTGSFSGTPELVPLIGGSGGGGGAGGEAHIRGAGGGGGGGAILLAATGTVRIDGAINVTGGGSPDRGTILGVNGGFPGAGSGGAVRIVATKFEGSGSIFAMDGFNNQPGSSLGRIRVEFELATSTTPALNGRLSMSKPAPLFPPTGLGLRIVRVGDVAVPTSPIGSGDVTLPASLSNPVAIQVETTQIPVGSVIAVSLNPPTGQRVEVQSPPTTGTLNSALASVTMDVPPGASVLSASVTFTITAASAQEMSRFAQGEAVDRVRLEATPGQATRAIVITQTGREFALPAHAMVLVADAINSQ